MVIMMKISNEQIGFWFAPEDIDKAKIDPKTWHFFVRNKEAEFIFSVFGKHKFKSGLELGAGNGAQSVTIAKHCAKLICTELDKDKSKPRNIPNVKYLICDAEDLSRFSNHRFDLIFSSNMIEHLNNPINCLKECKRVLAKDGIIIVTVPNRTWKVFSFFLSFLRPRIPRVHGTSSNHITEFISFNPKNWENKFKEADLKISKRINLPFYVGHSNRFIPLLKFGNKIHLSASKCFILASD